MSRTRKQRTEPRAYIGGYIEPELKEQVETIARELDRSVNWVMAFFLAEGVKHLNGKRKAK